MLILIKMIGINNTYFVLHILTNYINLITNI